MDASNCDDEKHWKCALDEEDREPKTRAASFWDKLLIDDEKEAGFECAFVEGDLHLYSDGYGTPIHAAQLIHHFLKSCRPKGDDIIVLGWADTESTLTGAFGGGVAVITKSRIHEMNTWRWADVVEQRIRKAQEKSK